MSYLPVALPFPGKVLIDGDRIATVVPQSEPLAADGAERDVAIRDAIEDGLIDGPRVLAAVPELTVTGGLGDGRKLHLPLESFGVSVDGPDEMLRMVRLCLREGVDTIKLSFSGDFGTGSAPADAAVMTDGEISVAVEATHVIGRRVAAHARASDSVKRAVRHGVDIIYHYDFADEEALDLLEAAQERVFTGPPSASCSPAWRACVATIRARPHRLRSAAPAL